MGISHKRKEPDMLVVNRVTRLTLRIDANQSSINALRTLQETSPKMKVYTETLDNKRRFIVELGDLDLSHATLSSLNAMAALGTA